MELSGLCCDKCGNGSPEEETPQKTRPPRKTRPETRGQVAPAALTAFGQMQEGPREPAQRAPPSPSVSSPGTRWSLRAPYKTQLFPKMSHVAIVTGLLLEERTFKKLATCL